MVRRGSRNSPARCVTASQPANAQTYRLAAAPTPAQPCGAKGTRFAGSAAGRDTRTTPTTRTTSAPVSASWTGPASRRPTALVTSGGHEERRADEVDVPLRAAEHRDDVLRPEQRHDRRPDADAEEEPVAGHPCRGGPEGEPDVGRDAAGVGVPGGEGGERRGERDGGEQDGGDGDEGRRSGRAGGQGGQQQDPGAEHRGHVERGAEREPDAWLGVGARRPVRRGRGRAPVQPLPDGATGPDGRRATSVEIPPARSSAKRAKAAEKSGDGDR